MSYSTSRGLVELVGVRSEAEEEELYQSVKAEEAFLAGLLEANNAALIRSGIGHKIEQAEIAEHEYAIKEYGRHHRLLEPITPQSIFEVSQAHAHIGRGNRPPDPFSICAHLHNPDRGICIVFEIGRRIMSAGQVLAVEPEAEFSEEDVLLAGSLIDKVLAGVSAGHLPHLDSVLMNGLSVWADPLSRLNND